MQIFRRLSLLLALTWGAPLYTLAQVPFAEESAVKINLREAVFRYMFTHYNYGSYVKVYCIEAERPLPENFLSRFAGNQTPVVWSSDCVSDAVFGVKEKKTGKQGIRMSIQGILWNRGDEAEVKVEAYSDGLAANWNNLTMVFSAGKWSVKKDELTGQS